MDALPLGYWGDGVDELKVTRRWVCWLVACLRPFLIGPEHGVHEKLCLLEIFKLAVWFLIDVFDLGEQLCSRPWAGARMLEMLPVEDE